MMLATCTGLAVLARRGRGARRWVLFIVAGGLAAGWGSLALDDDTLPATGAGAWIEACAPAAGIVVAWLSVRRRR